MSVGVQKVVKATRLLNERELTAASQPWDLRELQGQIVELSEEVPFGALTFTSELIRAAQQMGEPVGWIAARPSVFYPPDLAANGIDASAVTVVSVSDEREAVWSCDLLVRSGAFGLVVVDLEKGGRVGDAAMARLVRLARRHRTAVLFLTVKGRSLSSLSSLVTLRGVILRSGPLPVGDPKLPTSPLVCEITAVKDKRRTPGRKVIREYDGPIGVC